MSGLPHGEAAVAVPLRAWSDSQASRVADRLGALVRDWHQAWELDGAEQGAVAARRATPRAGASHALAWSLRDGVSGRSVTAHEVLETKLFGEATQAHLVHGNAPVVAQQVARMAWEDWLARVVSLLATPVQPEPLADEEGDGQPNARAHDWSGALGVNLEWCGAQWTLHLPGNTVERLLRDGGTAPPTASASDGPLIGLSAALAGRPLEVRALLAPATVTLGDLQSLSIGDVLVSPHALVAPVHVGSPGSPSLCDAWLGTRDGQVALELIRIPAQKNPLPT